MTSEAAERHLPELDLLRFAAALLVAAFHLLFWITVGNDAGSAAVGTLPSFREAWPLVWFGWVGVEIFFVISGFVIASSAARSLPWRFTRSRLLRLYPAAILCGLINAAVLWLIGPPDDLAARLARSLVIWPEGPWIDGSYWTLPIELAFYAMVFAILAIRRVEWLERAAICLGLASTIYVIGHAALRLLDVENPAADLAQALVLRHGCLFALGVVLRAAKATRYTAGRLGWIAIFGAGAMIEIAAVAWSHSELAGQPRWAVVAPASVFLAAVVVVALSGLMTGRHAVLRQIGLATYPLYLLHDTVGLAMIGEVQRLTGHRYLSLGVAVGVVLLASLAVSAAEPFLRRRVLATGRSFGSARGVATSPD